MSQHVYVINQMVKLRRGGHWVRWPDTRYVVVKCMPAGEHGQPQYLLSNMSDQHQRVVAESQIEGPGDEGGVVEPLPPEKDVSLGRA